MEKFNPKIEQDSAGKDNQATESLEKEMEIKMEDFL